MISRRYLVLLTQLAIGVSAMAAVILYNPSPSHGGAPSYVVDSVTDAVDANPGDGECATATGDCTLRAAIQEANTPTGLNDVSLPPGEYTLSLAGAGEDAAASGDLDITDSIVITGAGADVTIINADGIDRVIQVDPLVTVNLTVKISGVAITGGSSTVGGAGILNSADLTLTGVAVRGNSATLVGGAGISNLVDGTLTVMSSELSGNTATVGGGALLNTGAAELTNVTISGNTATTGAAVSSAAGTVDVNFTTISDNTATVPLVGAAVRNAASTVTFSNTLIAGNSPNNCTGLFTSAGYNLEDAAGCGLASVGDQQNATSGLGALQDNGGTTFTHNLTLASDARDAATPFCPDPPLDQRGAIRPADGDGVLGARCDVGAFEADAPFPTPTPQPSDDASPSPSDTPQPSASPQPSGTQSPTGTPSPSPTPQASGSPPPTQTPSPTSTPTSHTPTPTPSPTTGPLWGDVDCDGDVQATDSLAILVYLAGFAALPQLEPCDDLGIPFAVPSSEVTVPWGDLDCDTNVEAVDALADLKWIAGLTPVPQDEPCPDVGHVMTA